MSSIDWGMYQQEKMKENARLSELNKQRQREKNRPGAVRSILTQGLQGSGGIDLENLLSTDPQNKTSILGTGF